MKIVIRTEVWNTRTGQIIKAVARDSKGKILGATNQTSAIAAPLVIVGRK